jgi:hypothetical protein
MPVSHGKQACEEYRNWCTRNARVEKIAISEQAAFSQGVLTLCWKPISIRTSSIASVKDSCRMALIET